MKPRFPGVDALRALALLAVVIVNVAGYRTLPWGGPLPPLTASDGPLAGLLSLLAATLLQGKGVALLTLLFGYSLSLGRPAHARARLDRLLGLGLLHGFLVYCGDILSSYALCAYAALRHRRGHLGALWRRALIWLICGLALLALLLYWSASTPAGEDGPTLVAADGLAAWLAANAAAYGTGLIATLIGLLPLSYGLMLCGLVAGRLRLFHHRRWQPLWRRLARLAPWLLLLNLGYGLLYTQALREGDAARESLSYAAFVLGPLSLLGWLPWLLLRRWPDWLLRAGRNTLSVYIGSSLCAVLLWAPFALGLQTGVAGAYLLAFAVWLGLMALAAALPRLPLEAWMARRSPA